MEKTTLYIPDEIRRGLKEAARREGRSLSELVRQALREYLSKQAPPRPRSVGSGADTKLSGRESEAWLKAAWRRR